MKNCHFAILSHSEKHIIVLQHLVLFQDNLRRSQKHEALFDQNKQHEQSLKDSLETLLMLQYNKKDIFSINQS